MTYETYEFRSLVNHIALQQHPIGSSGGNVSAFAGPATMDADMATMATVATI